jgi:hypothetical protein
VSDAESARCGLIPDLKAAERASFPRTTILAGRLISLLAVADFRKFESRRRSASCKLEPTWSKLLVIGGLPQPANNRERARLGDRWRAWARRACVGRVPSRGDMRPISTLAHGILDYTTGAVLLGLPRIVDCSPALRQMMTAMAATIFGYSVITRYELGLVKVLPMPAHLAFDAVNGVLLLMAPMLFLREEATVKNFLFGMGFFSIAAALLTRTESPRPSLVTNLRRVLARRV